MKLKSLAFATGLAVSMMSGFAHAVALPLEGIFEDDNKERVIDANGDAKTSGSLAVGDTLIAVVKFNNVLNPDQSVFTSLNGPEFVYGLSAIQITSIVGGVASFGPNADFEAIYGTGAMAALFTSGTGLNLACASIAACEGAGAGGATSGSSYLTLGFADSSDFWIAGGATPFSISTDLATVAGTSGGTKVAVANYALSVLDNNTGYTFLDQDCPLCVLFGPAGNDGKAAFIGSGDVLGGAGLAGPYVARSDFDFTFETVPEPGTLALLGMGLVGMGWSARRRTGK
jgi:hypothetical protein